MSFLSNNLVYFAFATVLFSLIFIINCISLSGVIVEDSVKSLGTVAIRHIVLLGLFGISAMFLVASVAAKFLGE